MFEGSRQQSVCNSKEPYQDSFVRSFVVFSSFFNSFILGRKTIKAAWKGVLSIHSNHRTRRCSGSLVSVTRAICTRKCAFFSLRVSHHFNFSHGQPQIQPRLVKRFDVTARWRVVEDVNETKQKSGMAVAVKRKGHHTRGIVGTSGQLYRCPKPTFQPQHQ